MEIYENHFQIGEWFRRIYEKLNKGICIIAIQKKRNQDVGTGGDVTLQKPRLYLTMDYNKLTIKKAKNVIIDGYNPNEATLDFKLRDGHAFDVTQWWNHNGSLFPPDLRTIKRKR